MSHESRSVAPSKAAARYLTVTYYVDPRSMRTIQIPIGRANVLLASSVMMLVWAAVGLLYAGYQVGGHLSADDATRFPAPTAINASLDQAPAAVSEPGAQAPAVVAEQVEAARPSFEEADLIEASNAENAERAADALLSGDARAPAEAAPEPMTMSALKRLAASASGVVAIRPAQMSSAAGELAARFALVNQARQKTSGRVWGVATFVAASGESIVVGSNPGIDLSNPENANVDDAITFAAARHTFKKLQFKAPAGVEGRFAQVRLFVKPDGEDQVIVSEQEVAD